MTCQDSHGEVEKLQAGGEGADEEPAGGKEPTEHHCRPAGPTVTNQAADRSYTHTETQSAV